MQMAPNRASESKKIPSSISKSQSQTLFNCNSPIIDDDDFQDCSSFRLSTTSGISLTPAPLKPHKTTFRPSKKLKCRNPGKENHVKMEPTSRGDKDLECRSLDSIESTLDLLSAGLAGGGSIESRLLRSRPSSVPEIWDNNDDASNERLGDSRVEEENGGEEEFSEGDIGELDMLLKLCEDVEERGQDTDDGGPGFQEQSGDAGNEPICCPLCGSDISGLSGELRQAHTNECLDKAENLTDVSVPVSDTGYQCPGQVLDGSPDRFHKKVVDVSPVLDWLRNLGLAKYEEIFVREEIDWGTLQWLTEEDLCSIGISALGPRRKIIHALGELREGSMMTIEVKADVSKVVADETKIGMNKLITDYFSGSVRERRSSSTSVRRSEVRSHAGSANNKIPRKTRASNGKQKDIPLWCCIPGTPFRVDAFKYLRRDCFHWFLTHFHMDHYQGLTRSFCHGMIYCSSVTAKLVNLKIGISWDKIKVLPLNQKITIAGVDVTCFDANHCPGAIIILFEPPNGKAVLHTGDFRFGEEMARISLLQTCPVHTLILDTTYCDPQYDFPKQDAVIQFVIDAIQAEDFNPKTLFLIGSYTIGKERLFVEVAKTLRKKVYVTSAKLRLMECLGLPEGDMQWLTPNELESQIHVVPMWSIASFKRLKHMSHQYMSRFSLIVAFSPTGWTFGKGKKKSPGRRWQQGTIIRYEVPYSEHSSFTELKEFVKLVSPVGIIPSVNNHGADSQKAMVSQLLA